VHPLQSTALICWLCLLLFQLSLLLPAFGVSYYWSLPLILLLLLPLRGLYRGQRYTYKWVGFLMLLYFCVGISELVSNPELQIYGFGTTMSSLGLFLAGVYYARYLGLRQRG